MRERPILFSGPMVRALLDGRKTQTRRVVNEQPTQLRECGHQPSAPWLGEDGLWRWMWGVTTSDDYAQRCPYGVPGDRLWVRETWQYADWTEEGEPYIRYAADNAKIGYFGNDAPEDEVDVWAHLSRAANYEIDGKAADRRWRPSIFMPRWAGRIALTITDVRVERLQDISEEDAIAEGAVPLEVGGETGVSPSEWSHIAGYACLWDSLNGKRSPWSSNPWVWVLTFAKCSHESASYWAERNAERREEVGYGG